MPVDKQREYFDFLEQWEYKNKKEAKMKNKTGFLRLTLVLSVLWGTIYPIIEYAGIKRERYQYGFPEFTEWFFKGFITIWIAYAIARWIIPPIVKWIIRGFEKSQ